MEDAQIKSALNIMRRMPPSEIEDSLNGLIGLAPDMTEDLLQRVDQPLQVAEDESTGRRYLLCDYNRDGDSYRSPWSNKYFPAMEDGGFFPSDTLRALELDTNEVFDAYKEQYYEKGVSSVYLWDLESEGSFAGCFLIKKEVQASQRGVKSGNWDSIHVLEVNPQEKGKANYKLTTTIILMMATDTKVTGEVCLSGNLTRQDERTLPTTDEASSHIANMGKMIEDMEIGLRRSMDALYIQKTSKVVSNMRNCGKSHQNQTGAMAFMSDLGSAVSKHGAKKH